MPDLVPSLVRTIVPVVVTAVGPWVLTYLGVDSAQLAATLSVVLTGAAYAVVRVLEQRWPQAGWLLGWPTAPSYSGPGSDLSGE